MVTNPKEYMRNYMREYYTRNSEKWLNYQRIIKHEAFVQYCPNGIVKCAMCPEADEIVLTIDHINGGGVKHRKALGLRSGYDFYLWLKRNNYPKGYRVLYANCQLRVRTKVL